MRTLAMFVRVVVSDREIDEDVSILYPVNDAVMVGLCARRCELAKHSKARVVHFYRVSLL